MSERTTVVSTGGSGIAIAAIIIVALLVIVGLLWFTGAGRAFGLPSRIDVNVNPPPNSQPAPPPQQPAPEQPQNPNPMSYQWLVAPVVV
jgi:hypothetical protein